MRVSLFLTIILIARIVLLAALPFTRRGGFTAGFSGPFQSFVITAVYIVDANSPRLHIKTLETSFYCGFVLLVLQGRPAAGPGVTALSFAAYKT
jgi:hypothetical protein